MSEGNRSRLMTLEESRAELDKLPSIEEYRKKLGLLQRMDLKEATQEEIHNAFLKHCGILPYQSASLPEGIINHLKIYRVRVEIDEMLEDLTLLRTFSYPSAGQCTVRGRANMAHQPVFYASDSPMGAMAECRPTSGQTLFLSKWRFECPRSVNYRTLLPYNLPDTNAWHEAAKNQSRLINKHTRKQHPEKSEHLVSLYDMVSDLFVSELRPYPITSWLSSKILYDFDGMDFIVYPSWTSEGEVCNLAFHPNFIDLYARLEAVARVTLKSTPKKGPDMKMEFGIIKVGSVLRTHIHWDNPNDENTSWIP